MISLRFIGRLFLVQIAIVTAAAAQLSLSLVNHFNGSSSVNVYVTGIDSSNNWVLLQSDGTWYRPASQTPSATPVPITADIAIPMGQLGSTTTVDLPGYISSARIWVAIGSLTFSTVVEAPGVVKLIQPSVLDSSGPNAAIKWDFTEFTYSASGLFVNLSYVDFVGLALGISVESTDNSIQSVRGLSAGAMSGICNRLKEQTGAASQPWAELCVTDAANDILRILSPSTYISRYPTAFQGYYADYVSDVWTAYNNHSLIINTQGPAGDVQCTTSGNNLTCAGDNRGYSMPTTADIFSCSSGPFSINAGDNNIHQAVVPRLCAAFQRTVLTLEGGNIQPGPISTAYYTISPTNYYSKFVHDYEIDRKGYAFPYDDVNPTGEDESGLITSSSPIMLTVTVNGP